MSNGFTKRYCGFCKGELPYHRRRDAKFCNDTCRKAFFDSNSRSRSRYFVGLDGEGFHSAKRNEYVLLAASTGQYIQARKGLSTRECLEFLLSLPKGSNSGPKPFYIWFAMDYDVNMILRDLPEEKREKLVKSHKVWWRGYSIFYIRRKIFRISHNATRRNFRSTDIHSFYQSSFEKALTGWGIKYADVITEGKATRGSLEKWSNAKIREYNDAELEALAIMGERLRDAVLPLDLQIQSWYGPGALAGAWLGKNHVEEWMPDASAFITDSATIFSSAYFGGRNDSVGYGFVEPIYHYDIVSAYPSAIRYLPSLRKVKWKRHRKGIPSGKVYVARIRWQIPTTYWAPFPWRSRHGSILWPTEGEGWYWHTEIEAALEKYPTGIEVVEAWVASEDNLQYPFKNLIEETFEYRNQLKQQGSQANIAIKLILNSLYGKFAQTIGKFPRFSCAIWAGMITAHTRAQIQRAMNPETVLVMTDGLWTAAPISVPTGNGLGDWEFGDEKRLWLIAPGIYEAETADSVTVTQRTRGFEKTTGIPIRQLVEDYLNPRKMNCTYHYKVNRFVGMNAALQFGPQYPWRSFNMMPRRVNDVSEVGTTKRYGSLVRNLELDSSFVRLPLRMRDEEVLSYPYSRMRLRETARMETVLALQNECDESEVIPIEDF